MKKKDLRRPAEFYIRESRQKFWNGASRRQEDFPRKMKKLGIVLGAGGMRGVAQVGFLKALYENGMKPDCVAGASSGALIGAAIAAGMEPEYIFGELRKLKVYNILASFPNLLGAGIFSTKRIHRRLERYLGKKTISELDLPFCCVATELEKGELKVFDGDTEAVSAVMVSCCIPAIFKPEVIDGVQYVDGGLLSRLPIDPIRRFEPEVVIAVDTGYVSTKKKNFRNFVGVLWQMYEIMSSDGAEERIRKQAPDLIICPKIEDMTLYNMHEMDYAYSKGYEAGIENIERIKELLR